LRRFVPSFVEIVKPLQDMIKKNADFKWGPKEKESFIKIKEEIAQAPTLMSLYFAKTSYSIPLLLTFICSCPHTKNDEGNEFPISFMSF
jgi:hypothetical protein